jgi:hypothetical protein
MALELHIPIKHLAWFRQQPAEEEIKAGAFGYVFDREGA